MSNKKKEQLIAIEKIEEKIYHIRGEKIMLDSDLAEIYGVETKVLKQAVRRNLDRFPKDFMFEITLEELRHIESLRSQNVTLKTDASKRGRHSKYKPFVFTEHGSVMLASVLKSQTAIEASIQVVRAFVQMRSIMALHKELAGKIEKLQKVTDKHSLDFVAVRQLMNRIFNDPKFLKRKIGFVEEKKGKPKK